jgi:hypothetical protein
MYVKILFVVKTAEDLTADARIQAATVDTWFATNTKKLIIEKKKKR